MAESTREPSDDEGAIGLVDDLVTTLPDEEKQQMAKLSVEQQIDVLAVKNTSTDDGGTGLFGAVEPAQKAQKEDTEVVVAEEAVIEDEGGVAGGEVGGAPASSAPPDQRGVEDPVEDEGVGEVVGEQELALRVVATVEALSSKVDVNADGVVDEQDELEAMSQLATAVGNNDAAAMDELMENLEGSLTTADFGPGTAGDVGAATAGDVGAAEGGGAPSILAMQGVDDKKVVRLSHPLQMIALSGALLALAVVGMAFTTGRHGQALCAQQTHEHVHPASTLSPLGPDRDLFALRPQDNALL
jgi:hypothetical protein